MQFQHRYAEIRGESKRVGARVLEDGMLSRRPGEAAPLRFAMKDENSFNLNAFRRNHDAAESVSRHPSDALKLFSCPLRETRSASRFRGGGILRRINKLPNFAALFVYVGEVLFAEPPIHLELLLGTVLFAGANVSLAQTIVSVSKIGIELKRADILRDGSGMLILVGVEIAELQVGFRQLGVEGQRFAQQGFDLMEIQAGILGALALP